MSWKLGSRVIRFIFCLISFIRCDLSCCLFHSMFQSNWSLFILVLYFTYVSLLKKKYDRQMLCYQLREYCMGKVLIRSNGNKNLINKYLSVKSFDFRSKRTLKKEFLSDSNFSSLSAHLSEQRKFVHNFFVKEKS